MPRSAYVALLYGGAFEDVAPVLATLTDRPAMPTGPLRDLCQYDRVALVHLVGDDDGLDRLTPDQADELDAAIARIKPDVVVLDSCYSPAEAQALSDRVPHVIGLPGRMGRENANVFLARWYQEYTAGRPVLDAFDDAFDAIPGLDLPDLLRPGHHGRDEENSHFRGHYANSPVDVTVWYGTNRVPAGPSGAAPYGVLVDDQLYLGRCVVRVPGHIQYGQMRTRLRQQAAGLTGRYTLIAHQRLPSSEYWQDLALALDGAPFDRRDAVVHIRGYKCLFHEAAVASAQLHVDLKVRGVSTFYSFPSRGTRSGYLADDEAAQHAERYLYAYLQALAASSAVRKVHVIAYSLGGRLLLRVAMRAVLRVMESDGLRLGQVVLAGADISQRFFCNEAAYFREIADGVTLYISSGDLALKGSAALHQTPRAGQTPPVTIVDGISTIDVSGVDMSLLGHGYFQRAAPVLTDMHALLVGEPEPADRPRLRQQLSDDGRPYWVIRP
jgi:esterase/lipase superfamily enzyme